MQFTSSPIPADSHVAFAQSVMGLKIPEATEKYLENKHERFLVEDKNCGDEHFGFCWYLSRQVSHLLLLPGKTFLLGIQIIADAAILGFALCCNACYLGTEPQMRKELLARGYNLFVADALSVLAIPASVFYYNCYIGAEALHLGTVRQIMM